MDNIWIYIWIYIFNKNINGLYTYNIMFMFVIIYIFFIYIYIILAVSLVNNFLQTFRLRFYFHTNNIKYPIATYPMYPLVFFSLTMNSFGSVWFVTLLILIWATNNLWPNIFLLLHRNLSMDSYLRIH